MPVETDDDRAGMLNADEFGELATYTPRNGVPLDIAGIFNDPALSLALEHVEVSSSTPSFACRTADLPAATDEAEGALAGDRGDTLALTVDHPNFPAGTVLRVLDLQDDGVGMTTLTLARSAGVPE